MINNQEKGIAFHYSKSYQGDSIKEISVIYYSDSELSLKEKTRIYLELNNYLDGTYSFKKDDIISIISFIRKITEDLNENKLQVCIVNDKQKEFANYSNGYIESYELSNNYCGNIISITCNWDNTDIRFKRSGFRLLKEEGIEIINNELSKLYKKAIILGEMSKPYTDKIDNNMTLKLTN